jgi:hypothetical protein
MLPIFSVTLTSEQNTERKRKRMTVIKKSGNIKIMIA